MASSKRTSVNMIEGKLGKKILLFALPLAATGILQQLFNAADVAIVGTFVGEHAMAAVGSNTPILSLLLNLFIGISLGANVVTSRFTGRRDDKMVSVAVHSAITLALISGFLVMGIGELLAPTIIHALGVPPEVSGMALLYLRIYLLGMPVIMLYNFVSAIFRSQGDTRTPLLCLTISGILNVGLNTFFVLVCHMSVEGVAIATVVANAVSSILLLLFLAKRQDASKFRFKQLCLNKSVVKESIRIGAPAGLQGMVFSLSNLLIQSAINSLGPTIMAASAAAVTLEILAFYILNAFGQACTTFIGQNYGARKPDRCRTVAKLCVLQGVIATVLVSLLVIAFAAPLLHLFNDNPQVIENGVLRLRVLMYFQFANGYTEILSGAMRGYGYSLIPAVTCLLGICGTRIFWVYTIFPKYASFRGILVAYPVSWCVTAIAVSVIYLLLRKRFFRAVLNQSA